MSGARKHGKGMRPAGGDRQSPQRVKNGQADVRENIAVVPDEPVVKENNREVPLSAGAEDFCLRTVPGIRVPTGEASDSGESCVPSAEMQEGVVRRSDAVVSTTSVTGAAPPANHAGVVAPADLARTDVPAVAGMKFLAVAEVYSWAVDDEGAPLVICDSKQRSVVVEVDPVWSSGMTLPEALEHSVVGVPIEVGNSLVDRVTMPNPIEHSGVR